jgi:plastocyanin
MCVFGEKIHGKSSCIMAGLIATILIFTMVAFAMQSGEALAQTAPSTMIQANSFIPPPGFSQARQDPSFVIHIPQTDLGSGSFEPRTISIPSGMTVIWFNDDQSEHSVTVNTTSSNLTSSNASDSGLIAPGGSYTHQFTSAGTYDYYDSQNPSSKGRIKVGSEFETGKNMDMLVGGNALPFNPSKLARVTLSFVPHASAATIPPDLSITYNVTISNSTKTLYKNQFEDSDGILDLELIPTSKSNITQHFVSWGPDLIDNEAVASDGVYHVQGPVLVDNGTYNIQVSIVAKSGNLPASPITDTFALPSSGGP